jgi:pyridoxal phosphate enzyme (YggS family)
LKKRIEQIKARMTRSAQRCDRNPDDIRLVAVSKQVSAERIREAIEAGVALFGENYIQEARKKINSLTSFKVAWHLIGHLQSNKAKYAVKLFDLIHSVDSFKLVSALNKEAKKINKIQQVLIQVNVGQDTAKSGISPAETGRLLKEIRRLENISVKGLMIMPPFFNDPEKSRPYFIALKDLRNRFREDPSIDAASNISMEELSMGMTADFEVAIECGATIVRVGTAIFGARN